MRIEVRAADPAHDGRARNLLGRLRRIAPVERLVVADVYLLSDEIGLSAATARGLFADPVAQRASIDVGTGFAAGAVGAGETRSPGETADASAKGARFLIEIASRAGVTDPVAITAREAIAAALGVALDRDHVVQTARQYLVECARALDERELERLTAHLHNPLVQQAVVVSEREWLAGARLPALFPHRVNPSPVEVERFDLDAMGDGELEALSRRRLLALNLEEMRAIRAALADPALRFARSAEALDGRVTDVELEMIAQTWSEHCKHKIFNATVRYTEDGRTTTITSLFDTYIKRTTEELAARKPFLKSVFHDNSGVIEFDEEHLICFKVETHNSPSALDPYGGAITGIVGVNRDILGTGKGARPLFNTDVLCFGPLDTPESELPPGLLHPGQVLEGVHRGIVDGGNQSGIPVVAGAFLFDESYVGKPLVFCGTGGILPATIRGEASWVKHVDAGDLAVMVGGRIGKDGIHGATFSSQALDESSPTSAVQIGDPITQRKMSDFLLEARDLGLYKGITDNGAGGLSSSLGEMARLSGGVRIELDRCPLKYSGLAPWEVLVSESQERMSLAVAPATIDELLALAARRDVEATVVGSFTDSGWIHVLHAGRSVALLPLEFLHDGLPVMELEAQWPTAPERRPAAPRGAARRDAAPGRRSAASARDLTASLLAILADPSVASKEALIRQYDHEVQGASVIKPFVGARADGPSDGAVIRPVPGSTRGLTVTHGICPGYGAIDAYDMAMCAVDEAFRAHVALGGDPERAAALDNFCWPDPVLSESTPDGKLKLAQLVRACRGLRDACLAYGIPLISGKDSMKNDAKLGGKKVSIKPTLLVSLIGIIEDVRAAVTSDLKRPGGLLYLAGDTRGELGGTMFARYAALPDPGACPGVEADRALALYRALHTAMRERAVESCHDLSDGGLAAAVAECAIGGRLGAELELGAVARPERLPHERPVEEAMLFAETPSRFLIEVRPEHASLLERCFAGLPLHRIGTITEAPRFRAAYAGRVLVDATLEQLVAAWRGAFPTEERR